MTNVVLAFLEMSDGTTRQTCVGCTDVLLARGMVEIVSMVEIVKEYPAPDDETCLFRLYRIRYPFTLEGCRRAIKDRHRGQAWGT